MSNSEQPTKSMGVNTVFIFIDLEPIDSLW